MVTLGTGDPGDWPRRFLISSYKKLSGYWGSFRETLVHTWKHDLDCSQTKITLTVMQVSPNKTFEKRPLLCQHLWQLQEIWYDVCEFAPNPGSDRDVFEDTTFEAKLAIEFEAMQGQTPLSKWLWTRVKPCNYPSENMAASRTGQIFSVICLLHFTLVYSLM
jgi:hypothetical protein